jgi:DNA-binding GntR family transcriptional regulator
VESQLFRPVTPKTLRDEIVDALRDAITRGRLKPGEHLKENTIAAQMSVSRSPIREAFRQLEQEGLIVSIPNQGSFVKHFDEKDVCEIFTLRAALEGLACDILIRDDLLQPADFEQLEHYIEQQKQAIEAQDFEHLTELDMAFHRFICQRTGFERLVKMWQDLCIQMQVLLHMRFKAKPDYVPQTVAIDHAAIVEALRERDIERFSRINEEVNTRVAAECTEVIQSQ